jgi:outer membrane protein assembly factor BamB
MMSYSFTHSLPVLFLFLFLPSLFAQNGGYSSGGYLSDEYSDVPIWRYALGGSVIGNPVAQIESVVAATDSGNLKSFSAQGKLLWDYYARGRLTPFVSRSREGTSYICRTNGLFIAINRSGRELWQLDLKSPLVYPVLIGWDGRLFIFTDKKITCATAAGCVLWSKTLEAKIALAPVRDSGGGIILALENSSVLRIDAFSNTFSYSVSSVPAAAVSMKIERYGLAVLLLHENQNMELLIPALGNDGSIKARLDLRSPPLVAAGKDSEAAVLLKDGNIALLTPEYPPPSVSIDRIPSGMKILWTETGHINPSELTGADSANLVFDERGVYVLSKEGATGFADDGRRLWQIRLTGAAVVPAFGDDGILFSGGADWVLYAYRLESRVIAKQRLLYGEKSEGDYGTGNPPPSSWAGYYFRSYDAELQGRFTEIRQAIRSGTVGAGEKEYAAYLMETASDRQAYLQYRLEAAGLLAYIGSRETIPFLVNLFSRESEPLIKTAAAAAIGKIGVDPEGLALRAFENAILPPSRLLDEEALTAVASAIGALCRFSGPPLSEGGVRLLIILSGYDMFSNTRNQAQWEIRSLWYR